MKPVNIMEKTSAQVGCRGENSVEETLAVEGSAPSTFSSQLIKALGVLPNSVTRLCVRKHLSQCLGCRNNSMHYEEHPSPLS